MRTKVNSFFLLRLNPMFNCCGYVVPKIAILLCIQDYSNIQRLLPNIKDGGSIFNKIWFITENPFSKAEKSFQWITVHKQSHNAWAQHQKLIASRKGHCASKGVGPHEQRIHRRKKLCSCFKTIKSYTLKFTKIPKEFERNPSKMKLSNPDQQQEYICSFPRDLPWNIDSLLVCRKHLYKM